MPPRTALVLALACLWAAPALAQQPLNRDYTDLTVLPDQPYPLWVAPRIAPPGEAEVDLVLQDGDLVIGVEIAGEARAYPVGYFWGPAHEVLNDTLGGTPLAPSW